MRTAIRRRLARALVPVYLLVIGGMPLAATSALVAWPTRAPAYGATLLLALPVFAFAYVITAGGLARLTHRAIVAGRFPRDLGHEVYGPRRLYALCWTSVYYFTPLYHAVLAIPFLKRITLRLFGYSGSLDVTLYPDTWIRDLPLLNIAAGAYIANRATLGTNMCMQDGTVVVAPITIGQKAMVGHLALIAPGTVIGDAAEIGVGCAIGIGVSIGRGAKVGPTTTVNHRAIIGEKADIGTMCLIGAKAVIHPRVRIPAGRIIPPRAVIRSDADVESLRRTTRVAALALQGE